MANQGKHRKDPVLEWLEGDEGNVPTSSRSSHLVNSYIKKNKPVVRKFRTAAAAAAAPPADPLQLREPGPPLRLDARPSPAASPDHLRKTGRLTRLRAPYQYKNR